MLSGVPSPPGPCVGWAAERALAVRPEGLVLVVLVLLLLPLPPGDMPLPSLPFARSAGRMTLLAAQAVAAVHLFTTHVAEVRYTVGTSMVPTMSPSGELVFCIKFGVYEPVRSWCSKWGSSSAVSSGASGSPGKSSITAQEAYDRKRRNVFHLQLGDLVVAVSPTNPARAVCKRVLGLPGDTLHFDPRDDNSPMVTVPRGHVWLAGDNINNSTDSRHYGSVPMALLRGRVVARVCALSLLSTRAEIPRTYSISQFSQAIPFKSFANNLEITPVPPLN